SAGGGAPGGSLDVAARKLSVRVDWRASAGIGSQGARNTYQGEIMKSWTPLFAVAFACASGALVGAEAASQSVAQHVEAARRAAGSDHGFIFGRLCEDPIRAINAAPSTEEVPAELPVIDPARKWYAAPARVFDDLFFLGQTGFS